MATERIAKLSVLLPATELSELERLADKEGVDSGLIVRRLIRREYRKHFGSDRPTLTSPTLRGILGDLTKFPDCTVALIAERTQLGLEDVVLGLKKLESSGLVELVHEDGPDSVWEVRPLQGVSVFQAAEAKGFHLDESLDP
jgi:hypothetical protein